MTQDMNETQIANLALQKCGVTNLLSPGSLWVSLDNAGKALAIRNCYHSLRREELRRRVWTFSVRRAALRAIDTHSKIVTFGTWAIDTTYNLNDVVVGSDGQIWQSQENLNLGNDPTSGSYAYWDLYFGPVIAAEFVCIWSGTITYADGDHTVGSDGQVYVSLENGNLNNNPVGDMGVHWVVGTMLTPPDMTTATDPSGISGDVTNVSFFAGELVFVGNQVYYSTQSNNLTIPPGSPWIQFTTAPSVSLTNIIYPLGAGPFSDVSTRNVYQLPNGYLREAPQAPKAGSTPWLGAPAGLPYNDWEYNGNYIVTSFAGVFPYRFAANLQNPVLMDPMYVGGFACRIGMTIAKALTGLEVDVDELAQQYKKFMTEAGEVNGIEQGPVEPPVDAYIQCRV